MQVHLGLSLMTPLRLGDCLHVTQVTAGSDSTVQARQTTCITVRSTVSTAFCCSEHHYMKYRQHLQLHAESSHEVHFLAIAKCS